MKKAGVSEFGRAFALAAAFAFAANAGITANWTPTASGSYSLVAPENWDGGVAPTNSEDVANFAPGEIAGSQTISLPGINGFNTWYLGTVNGAYNQTIRLPARHSNGSAVRYVYVADPSGFQGTWAAQDALSRLVLSPTNGVEQSLSTLNTSLSMLFYVNGGTAAVEKVTGGGTLMKLGAGELKVKGVNSAYGPRTTLRFGDFNSSATLEFGDTKYEAIPVSRGIYARFDASRADTFDFESVDGTNYVAAWRDAQGGPVSASPFAGLDRGGNAHPQKPWQSKASAAGGVPLVDFGAYENSDSNSDSPNYGTLKRTLGPAASLVFPAASNVRELFVAWQDTQSSGSRPFVIGTTDDCPLHRGGAGSLLDGSYSVARHENDETYVDGVRRWWTYATDYTKLTVASMNLSQDTKVNTLAQDRNIRFGGCRIAEVVIYTNELTSAERLQVHKYLCDKWQRHGTYDLREVRVTARDQPLGVADGCAVDVGTLNVPAGTTFLKKGGGTLNVGAVAPDGLSMNVQGGAVSFVRRIADIDDSAPAGGAALWLDAEVDASFVRTNLENGVSGRDYIHAWKDCRPSQTSIYALPMTAAVDTNRPFVVANAAGDLHAVDFGTGLIPAALKWNQNPAHDGSDAARLKISSNVNAYDGFIVLRMKNDNAYYNYYSSDTSTTYGLPPIFGSDAQDFTRWGDSSRILAGFASQYALAGHWTMDGVAFSPYFDTSVNPGTESFRVFAFSTEGTLKVNRIADDRNITIGGVQVGELILYTRRLDERERRSTEAYLMKKWLGKDSPDTQSAISLNNVTFADGAVPTIASDRDVTVESLSMPEGGVLGQSGEGSLTVESPLSGVGYSADGGTLNVKGGDPMAGAFYHFDATDAGSIVADRVVENGDGTSTTNIAQWLDVRRNGLVAQSANNSSSYKAVALPTLATVETKNGKKMPVVDFGDVRLSGVESETAAGMDIRIGGSRLSNADFVKELHVVYCDAHENSSGYGHRFIFADYGYYPFHRGDSNGQMFCAYGQSPYSDYVKAGYVAVDGEPKAYSYKLTDRQFHVISAAPTNSVPVRTIALDRNARSGGSYQGELIAFKEHLDAPGRLYVQKYLAWKWFGEGEKPVYTNVVLSVAVAHGGTVAFPETLPVSVPEIGVDGGGSVTAGRILGVSSLSFAFGGEGGLVASCPMDFAEEGTLRVAIPADAVPGEYPLLSATAFGGGNPLSWMRVVSNESNLCAALFIQDDTLYLRLTSKGTLMLFK